MQPQSMSHEDRRFFGALEVWKTLPGSGISRADAVRIAQETVDALLRQLAETQGIVIANKRLEELTPEEAHTLMARPEPTSLGGGFQDTRAAAEQVQMKTALLHLAGLAEDFMNEVSIPERNCSCHISPPCTDCVENSGLREIGSALENAIKRIRAEVTP